MAPCKLLYDTSLALARSSPTRRYTGFIIADFFVSLSRLCTLYYMLVLSFYGIWSVSAVRYRSRSVWRTLTSSARTRCGSACVSRGPDGTPLSSSYQNRSNERYLTSLGQTIANLGRLVPDGLLVFFPSYSMLRACHEAWQMNGVWGRIAANKVSYSYVRVNGVQVIEEGVLVAYGLISSFAVNRQRFCF